MAAKRTGARPQMIHCDECGEDYADSYKRCPFCEDRPPRARREPEEDDYDYESDEFEGEDELHHRGGKRLVANTRGGGYGGPPSILRMILTILSLAIIVAAVIIVITVLRPLVSNGQATLPSGSPSPSVSVTPGPSEPPAGTATPAPTDSPAVTPSPDPTGTEPPVSSPEPTPGTTPAGQTATSFTLDKEDFSMSDRYPDPIRLKVTFVPAGSTGTVTWSSSDPAVASVDENGKVSPGGKSGMATITAAMGSYTQICIVRSSVTTGGSSASPAPSGPSSGSSLALNKTDFTFTSPDDPSVQMKVSGTSSTPVWSIGDTSVATISGSGVVKPVGEGNTTVTCTVDGQTLKCIVRCRW